MNEDVGEVTFGSVLHDNIDIVDGKKRLIIFNDIGMLDELESFYLSKRLNFLFLLDYTQRTWQEDILTFFNA